MDDETFKALAKARIDRAKELLDQVQTAREVYEKAKQYMDQF